MGVKRDVLEATGALTASAMLRLWPRLIATVACRFDSSPGLRFRRPHPRHGGADLPLLGRGLRGPWAGAAVRVMGEDRGLLEPGIPPTAPPGGEARAAPSPGGDPAAHRAARGVGACPAPAARR